MKKILIPFLLLVFMFSLVDDASAQRRGKKKRRNKENTEEKDSRRSSRDDDEDYGSSGIKEKLNTEIKLGNLNFFGNQFSLSLKSNVGYKLNNTFTAGLGGKLYYDYINVINSPNDFNFTSYGGLAFARAKITKQLYVQAEYNVLSLEYVSTVILRQTFLYPSAGLGYMYEGFNWSSGIEVLVPFNDVIRDRTGIVEYWISFSHNF